MNNQIEKTDNNQIILNRISAAWFLLLLAGAIQPAAGESYIGKIVIDGVVMGENSSNVRKGSGVMGSDKRKIDTFQSIRVQGGVNVNYHRSQTVAAEVTGDENLLPIIKVQVSHGDLIISSTESYQTQLPLTVELSSPGLTEVTLDGAGDLNLKDLNGKSLKLNINGSGNANAEGKVQDFSVRVSGSGDVSAKNLNTEDADLQITGSGNIRTTVTGTLKATIIGSGGVTYFGSPKKVEPQIIGSGDVEAGD